MGSGTGRGDTVASIAGFTNLGKQRANFPLSRVRPDHPEIVLPGVHSNIGGGYRVEAQEQVLIGPMQGLTVTEGTEVTELQPLCDRFVAGDYRVTAAEEALLNLRYIHTSAHWNHPLDKTGQREARLLYINAPTADAVRVQHPHVPD